MICRYFAFSEIRLFRISKMPIWSIKLDRFINKVLPRLLKIIVLSAILFFSKIFKNNKNKANLKVRKIPVARIRQ